jgi:hypothetical protein
LRREIEQSLQHLSEDAEEEEDDAPPASYEVDSLTCIRTPHGTISKFFDLKPLEYDAPANGTQLTATNGDIFNYKICQSSFEIPEEIYYSNSTGT